MVICLFLIGLFCCCKTNSDSREEKELPPFHLAAQSFIQHKFTKKKLYPYKDQLVVVVNVAEGEDDFRDSNYVLRMHIWTKENVFIDKDSKDSIFEFEGVDIFFYDTKKEFQARFPKKFKRIIGPMEIEETSEKVIRDPLSEIMFYFNNKNEITFINLGQDTLYYNKLKNKIAFSRVFIENLGKPVRFDQ